ncbi:MAG TPA: MMPL family transporter [Desulfuromonadaceae bacterium]|jgi:predicted exporter
MPVPSFTVFEWLYRYLSGHRKPLFIVTLLIVALGCFATSKARIQEDIVAMLPDDNSNVARDFRLLQLAPFTRKIVITLKTGAGDTAMLTATADRLAQTLTTAGVGKVTTGPADLSGSFFGWLGRTLPSLANKEDLARLTSASSRLEVQKRLQHSYEQLLSPEGWALKGKIQSDPLSFSDLALEKMRFLNMIPNMRLVNNHFVAADGKSALLVVESAIAMTDSAGSRDLLARIDKAVAASVPRDMSATVLCGHRYTLLNADTIKRDLYVVLTVSAVAVLAIYLIFLRSLSAIFVFLVPSSILLIASGVIAFWQGSVFAVTLGFGGVLLGIADEYAMLIYFYCRQGGKDLGTITGEVARPVLFGAAATLISFGVMLMSSLPGQRQLAIYSMAGIVAAVLISLVVLPHLIKPAPQGALPFRNLDWGWRLSRRPVIAVWLVILALCGWQATKIRFNGDLRAVSMVSPELRQTEDELTRTWGDMRGKALIFAEGSDLERALRLNEQLFARISGRLQAGELVSIAPLLPSARLQEENRQRWTAFWRDGRAERLSADLQREGEAFGFSKAAFTPFLTTLSAPPPVATVEGLKQAGMGELVDSMIISGPGIVRVLTLVPDAPQVIAALSEDLKALPGVTLVSQGRFGDSVGRAIIRDFTSYMALTSLLVLVLVIALFRKPGRIALVLVPVVTGLICMLGIMGMLGLEFNIFNIAATILIIGICVDYGIFMVCRLTEGSDNAANRAVLVSGLTTLAGLGALALARHPSMQSIGITVLLGVGAGIPAALLVIPALCHKEAP